MEMIARNLLAKEACNIPLSGSSYSRKVPMPQHAHLQRQAHAVSLAQVLVPGRGNGLGQAAALVVLHDQRLVRSLVHQAWRTQWAGEAGRTGKDETLRGAFSAGRCT
jgi:hypothetical protein